MKALQEAYQDFNLEQLIATRLQGTAQALNAYTECCGRYCGQQHTALIWEGKQGESARWSFDQLAEASGKLANYFQAKGLKVGDCIAGLLPRTPELLITVLATWRMGAVYQPLFTAFESKAIEHRLEAASTRFIVTNTEQRAKLSSLQQIGILTVGAEAAETGDADFWQHQEVAAGEIGTLALDESQSPLMWFKGYAGHNRKSFVGQYYLTGDTVRLNELGGIDFIGRADDVITTSGYRVGPFDVESTLLECEEVLESAVVGKPDPERTEIVKAFVVLKAQFSASPALEQKLQQYVRSRLSKHAYPKEIEFVEALPKTSSGKIQRNILKQQEIDKQRLLEKVS